MMSFSNSHFAKNVPHSHDDYKSSTSAEISSTELTLQSDVCRKLCLSNVSYIEERMSINHYFGKDAN